GGRAVSRPCLPDVLRHALATLQQAPPGIREPSGDSLLPAVPPGVHDPLHVLLGLRGCLAGGAHLHAYRRDDPPRSVAHAVSGCRGTGDTERQRPRAAAGPRRWWRT